ncbi:hypothetical protein [Lederbergia panacisoli]|uniref:hypothetical protein n=1 Tax=Lederbergia panacisoli TaxID=1255251 RepID=UPI00214AD108|nr:hypothetical protein [Lederbergia panacisoli]MCR2820477.1 hypothetical protein [Lederbergia panacisoli]
MKKLSIPLLVLGAFITIIGVLPYIFSYPYSDGPNSGPSNNWELILIISYEKQFWCLLIGIALLLFSFFPLLKQQKV